MGLSRCVQPLDQRWDEPAEITGGENQHNIVRLQVAGDDREIAVLARADAGDRQAGRSNARDDLLLRDLIVRGGAVAGG